MGDQQDRLAPLPRRAIDIDAAPDFAESRPEDVVAEMLERASVLFKTLEADVAGLEADQEKERERIAGETQRLRAEADAAIDALAELTVKAFEIERRKGRQGVIDAALRGPAPDVTDLVFDDLAAEIAEEIRLAKGITGSIRIDTIARKMREATAVLERMRTDASNADAALLAQTEKVLNKETVEATASFEIGMGVLERDVGLLESVLPPSALGWGDSRWATWEPPQQPAACIRLGTYTDHRLNAVDIPALFDLAGSRGIVIEPRGNLDKAAEALRSILLRITAAQPPGSARFTVFDPEDLGGSIGPLLQFSDVAPQILEGGVHTAPEAIEAALDEIGAHMERVIQRYLRGQFTTLAEANTAAGEMLEAFHFVVIINYPRHLSETALERLTTMFSHGPRCGVYPIVIKDPTFAPVYGGPRIPPLEPAFTITANAMGFETTTETAGTWAIDFDSCPDQELSNRIILHTADGLATTHQYAMDPGRAFAMLSTALASGLHRHLPRLGGDVSRVDADDLSTWWHAESNDGVSIPLGRSGAIDLATLRFDDQHSGAVLLVGNSDAAVDQILQWIITGITMLYPPDQVHLDLVGLRGRRAFTPMANHALAHAKVISMDAEYELVASVVDAAVRELDRRAASTDQQTKAPRRIIVIDDLTALLASSDPRIERVLTQLERITSQGPAFGIHTLVIARDFSEGLYDRIGAGVFGTRIILAGTNPEAITALGGNQDDLTPLSSGEALVDTGNGASRITRRIRHVGIEALERDRILRDQRSLATKNRLVNRPQIFDGKSAARFEQSALTQLLTNVRKQEERLIPRLWLGEPMELGGPVEILLRRMDGSNLLVVGPNEDAGQGILLAAATTAVLGHGRNLEIRIVDFMSLESGFTEGVHALGENWPVTLDRRRNLEKVIDGVHRTVLDRGASGRFQDPPLLFCINGLGRARELDIRDDSNPELIAMLEVITSSGPEVGVHTLIWAETPDLVSNKLGHQIMSQFGMRAVMRIDAASSSSIIDTPAAEGLADNQALLYDETIGRLTRFHPYSLPDPEWVAGLSRAAAGL